jgi:hypothetical protein
MLIDLKLRYLSHTIVHYCHLTRSLHFCDYIYEQDWTPYFHPSLPADPAGTAAASSNSNGDEKKKKPETRKLIPRPSDLSYYNWETQT